MWFCISGSVSIEQLATDCKGTFRNFTAQHSQLKSWVVHQKEKTSVFMWQTNPFRDAQDACYSQKSKGGIPDLIWWMSPPALRSSRSWGLSFQVSYRFLLWLILMKDSCFQEELKSWGAELCVRNTVKYWLGAEDLFQVNRRAFYNKRQQNMSHLQVCLPPAPPFCGLSQGAKTPSSALRGPCKRQHSQRQRWVCPPPPQHASVVWQPHPLDQGPCEGNAGCGHYWKNKWGTPSNFSYPLQSRSFLNSAQGMLQ